MKVIVSCANGAGTSMMMMMKVKKAFEDLGVKVDISHCSISEGKAQARTANAVFCSQNFVNMFDDAAKKGTVIIGMKNILSVDEAKEKIQASGLLEK